MESVNTENTIKCIENNKYVIIYKGNELKVTKLSNSIYLYCEQMRMGSGHIALLNKYLKQQIDNSFVEISTEKALEIMKNENHGEKTL